MTIQQTITIANDDRDSVVKALRQHLPDKPSWSTAKRILYSRRIAVGGVLCIDEARKLARGEVITVHEQPFPAPPTDQDVKIHHVDAEVIIVEKPSGMVTLRRSSDLNWSWDKKNRQPTLDECVPRLIGEHAAAKRKTEKNNLHLPRMFPVHRIDRDSSGLLVFARNKESQTKIIHQFAQHAAVRKYLTLVPGTIEDQTITSQFIRDRGDGLRGSTTDTSIGEHATTHFKLLQKFERSDANGKQTFSELECSLETGRTNQIRIHLAELGHPICGDIKYRGPFGSDPIVDNSGIHRMALHATQLSFKHPATEKPMNFKTPWPKKMQRFLESLAQ
ncbi:RluA family pseudouridine synthase [Mariniblastus fucicola]|uniref:Ribosomal large subunit pseudouridine synthase D n=1 Tax=Mariniblastus fucicola TaxID=980251 RepID=A0A5B9P913_9BACT|nr:RluA family pseudouridine synthase [Mariniblastus fucicola]QEG21929.1 Ribosomal large subunit pseudouridine synthase D [Mariniblastus fucicola]